MTTGGMVSLPNGGSLPLREIARLEIGRFRDGVVGSVSEGARLVALFGAPEGESHLWLVGVLARDGQGLLEVTSTLVGDSYPSLTPDCEQAHLFEREIAEQWGVRPVGHPWLKPVRFHSSYRRQRDARGLPPDSPIAAGVMDFFEVDGVEVHQVGVGPVHAGIIEPGHFRFQCHGERVLHLEISLGYQHRGVERALAGGPDTRSIHYVETLAGDTSVGHATAYAHVLEALGRVEAPPRARALRGIALELERLANHAGDLGALAGDVGYLPAAAYCGRLRGEFLNLTLLACGNRLGRGWIRPGGVAFDLEADRGLQISRGVEGALRDLERAAGLLWGTSTVRARFEETGALSREACAGLGFVGPVARASGVPRDVRHDFPFGVYREFTIPTATCASGDVFARAHVRWLECRHSAAYLQRLGETLPEGPIRARKAPLAPDSLGVSLVEGWRGEICHVAVTDSRGQFRRYKVVDPSFHNWMGLALAMRGQAISDFPLCNKSFNLSYCGHDL